MKRKKIDIPQSIIIILLTIWAILTVYPVYNVFIVSLTPYSNMDSGKFYLIPNGFDLSTYKFLLSDRTVPRAILVSVIVTVAGTIYNLFLTVTMAYALSKKGYPGRKFFMMLVLITMFFSGGMIPYYLVVNSIGLRDSILSMIIPVGINVFYLILVKNYFHTLPESIEESAKIDGANDLRILASIILPVSKPIIATIALFYAVDRWNEYFNAMLFIKSQQKEPIQYVLRQMLIGMQMSALSPGIATAIQDSRRAVYTDSLRMGIVVITSIPILLVYPFVQKYFTKGIMLGSIKA